MFPLSLYFKIGAVGIVLSLLWGAYYTICYEPKKTITKKYEKSAKELREEYIKNSALELELVVCLNDKDILSFESEMKGAGDAIFDYNDSSNSDSLTF